MKKEQEVYSFDGGCGRDGKVLLEETPCGVCHKKDLCLYVDGSENEYASIHLCLDCIKDLFMKWEGGK